MTTDDDDLHKHCKRPIYDIYVRSQADVVLLTAVTKTADDLWEMAQKADGTLVDAAEVYKTAARLLDENFRAALAATGEVRQMSEDPARP